MLPTELSDSPSQISVVVCHGAVSEVVPSSTAGAHLGREDPEGTKQLPRVEPTAVRLDTSAKSTAGAMGPRPIEWQRFLVAEEHEPDEQAHSKHSLKVSRSPSRPGPGDVQHSEGVVMTTI